MRKICCANFKKYKEFKNPKISYICVKTLILSSICNKCGSEDDNTFKEEGSIGILNVLGLIGNI